jgi:hypothetical protein
MSVAHSILSTLEVREYLSDYPSENLLLDREEFSDTYIQLCMDMAADEFNARSPQSSFSTRDFPSKSLLLTGTLWKMYAGRSAVLARNNMSYSDGGLQIPIEERFQLYQTIATDFASQFDAIANRLKVNQNMESGWGSVSSDEAIFPIW